jgi:hypothetical protein
MATTESELERSVREEDEQHRNDELAQRRGRVEGTIDDEDPETGKLFDVAVRVDDTKPTLISVSISGKIKLDLRRKADVDFYNALKSGKTFIAETHYFVASTKKTHRRDNDGNVDAVPESKSLIVDLVMFDGAEVGASEETGE